MKYIDIHCHLNFPDFDQDREEAIQRANEAGVGMIVVGTGRETSKLAVEIAEKHQNIWAVVGLHPTDTDEGFEYEYYLNLAKNRKVVGIGECGYDYFRADEKTYAIQHEIFLKHIQLANEVKKPLMLHVRSGKKNAYKDVLPVLAAHAKVKGNVHFFAGTWEEARTFLDLGFTISVTGVITFARDYDEVIKNAPLDRIMSETDAPFLSPTPNRGKRNEPVYVREVAHKIASIRGEPEEKVLPQLVDNARKLFAI